MTRGVADPVGALWPFLRAIEASIPARRVTLAAADLDSVEAVPDGQEEIVQFEVSAWGADGRGDGGVRAALESEAVDPQQAVLGGHGETSQDRDRRSGGPAARDVGDGRGELGVLDVTLTIGFFVCGFRRVGGEFQRALGDDGRGSGRRLGVDRGRNRPSSAPTSTNELANGRVGDGPGQGLGDAMVRLFVVRWQPLRYARRMTGSQFSGV